MKMIAIYTIVQVVGSTPPHVNVIPGAFLDISACQALIERMNNLPPGASVYG
jgi:hypothetical protein